MIEFDSDNLQGLDDFEIERILREQEEDRKGF